MNHIVYVNNNENPYIIDDYGLELFNKHNWFASDSSYPYLRRKEDNKVLKFHIELMKNEILEVLTNSNTSKLIVDHINGNVFDNRKENLRVRTQSENNMNKKIQRNNTTGIVGIYYRKKEKMWESYIDVSNERIWLGRFYYLRNAVKVRIEAEEKYFGEHAFRNRDENYSNFIDSILSVPEIDEPVFTRRTGKYGINGVTKYKNGFRVKMLKDGIEKNKYFNDLESAIKHRQEFEINTYGKLLTFYDTKKDKQI